MNPDRLLVLALIGEGTLAAVALLWMWLRGLALDIGDPVGSLGLGLGAAVAAAGVNFGLFRYASTWPLVRSVRHLYDNLLRPMFAQIGLRDVVLISLAAGIGEELLFRGALQPEVGLVTASVLFGVAHLGGGGTVVFGAWAGLMGWLLGGLAIVSGGLLAPIVAHAAYDAMALAYIRWAPPLAGAGGSDEPDEPGARGRVEQGTDAA